VICFRSERPNPPRKQAPIRETIAQQPPLVASAIPHSHATELERVSTLLRGLRGAAGRVASDLLRGVEHVNKGRRGLSGDQELRLLVLKQLTGFSYEQLAFHLADSATYRRFCLLGIDGWAPKASTLQANVKRVRPETLEWINRRLMKEAKQLDIEDGSTVLVDSTAVESEIHHPTDNSLLFDSVRVLSRLLRRAQEFVEVPFSDHTKRAKRRSLGISNGRNMRVRTPLYRDLLKVTERSLGYAHQAIAALGRFRTPVACQLRAELQHYAALVAQVIEQTQRRVFEGEAVPAGEKLVSLFEPHAAILVKGGRKTDYGHKVCVTTGRSGLVLDLSVERGNTADSAMTVPAVWRVAKLFGAVPEQATFDAGFASQANQQALVEMGVTDAAFAKNSAIDVLQSVTSAKVHRALQRLRAGIEASISWLKRCFGFGRCSSRGFESFRAYAWASVLTVNLLQMSRLSV